MVDERKTRSRRQSTTSSASTSGPHSPHRRKAFAAAAVVVVDAEMLFEAIATGASRRLRKYLNEGGGGGAGGDAANVRDDAHRTLLMRICYLDEAEKRETMTRIVVEHGCNVNAQDELGRTALTYAALFGRDDVVSYLVGQGADALIEDVDGNGPLYHCASVGNAEIAWTLIKAYGGRGLNVNKRNLQGMTPLLQAAKLGHVHCAKVLVTEGGASTTVRDLDGFMNAEEWARFSGRFSNDDMLLLSPIVAKKMRCKEHRRSLGRKILSDYFIGAGSTTSNETKSGLIRQSFNTFHFVSQSDPEAVSSDDESAVTATAAVAGSLSYVTSTTSAPNLPSLAGGGGGGGSNVWSSLSSAAASSPVSPPSSQKSMFQIQLPKVKPPQLDGSGHETAAATATVSATRLHKIHTIREEDTTAGKKTGSGCSIKMTPTPPPPPPLATDPDIALRLPSVSNNKLSSSSFSSSSSSVAAGSSTLTLPYSSSPKTGKAIRRRTTGSSPLSKESTMSNGGGSRSPRRSKSKSI